MAGIFISYRRGDAGGWARSISDRLRTDFPGVPIFMDVDAIGLGANWREEIRKALEAADVFLAVLERDFGKADSKGRRRLDEPNDPVRHELAAALEREDVTVIPVLVGGATMPEADELPADVAGVTDRNALALDNAAWEAGIGRLVAEVRAKLRTPPPQRRPRTDGAAVVPRKAEETALLVGLGGAALVVVATSLRLDLLLHPDFGRGTVPYLGTVVAPAWIVLALGGVYSLLQAWRRRVAPLVTGVLLGFGVGGLVKYASLVGQRDPEHLGSTGPRLLGLAGSALLAGVATFWLVTRHWGARRPARVSGRVLATAGAVVMGVATFLPFSNLSGEDGWKLQILVERNGWEAFEPLALAAAVVGTVVLGSFTRQLVVAGVWTALGLLAMLLWARYVGVPVLQTVEGDDLASVRPGGSVGLAGAVLVFVAGIAGRERAPT